MSFQIGDVIALVRLAADLYQHGFKVAKSAPGNFQALLEELFVVRNILYRSQHKLKAQGRARDEVALVSLERTARALEKLKPLIRKYQRIGKVCLFCSTEEVFKGAYTLMMWICRTTASTDNGAYFKRIRYAVDKSTIDACRDEIRDSLNSLQQIRDLPPPNIGGMATSPIRRDSGQTLSTVDRPASREPAGEIQDDEARPLRAGRPSFHQYTFSTSDDVLLSATERSRQRPSQTSIRPRLSGSTPSSSRPDSIPEQGDEASVISSTLSSAVSSEQHSRPDRRVTLPKQDQDAMARRLSRRVDEKIEKMAPVFEEQSANVDTPQEAEKWLFQAVWWLLKSQIVHRALDSNRNENSKPPPMTNDWPLEMSRDQAFMDLLKSYSITKDIILNQVVAEQSIQGTTWKTLQDLATTVDREMQTLKSKWILNDNTLDDLSLEFAETLYQTAEIMAEKPCALDTFDENEPDRWLKVHQEDADFDDDRVLFRTFVNGKIGEPSTSRQSETAPYFLVMWCNRASSEIYVSLLNLAGSVNLCCSLSSDDISRNQNRSLEFHFRFPSQKNTIIRFLCHGDAHTFLTHAKHFFSAVEDRTPRQDEFLIARESLDEFETKPMTVNVRASIGGPTPATSGGEPCEISLYEEVPNECWKATRRLVLSSSPISDPFCFSYWMPISQVQTNLESQYLTLSWSDFSHLDERNRGNADWRWSYIYDSENPSFTVSLKFQKSEAAKAFQRSILQPFEMPYDFENIRLCQRFGWVPANSSKETDYQKQSTRRSSRQTGPKVTVWKLEDRFVNEPKEYIAVNSMEKRQGSTYVSELYLIYRDVDFELPGCPAHSVRLPGLQVPHYVSDIHNIPSRPDKRPKLDKIAHQTADLTLEFAEDKEIRRFLRSVSSRWSITGFCPAASFQLTHHRITVQTLEPVTASVWMRIVQPGMGESQLSLPTDKVRIAIRRAPLTTSRKEKQIWTTIKLSNSLSCSFEGRKIIFKDVVEQTELHQGETVDIYEFEAYTDGSSTRQRGRKLNAKLVFDNQTHAWKLYQLIQHAFEDDDPVELTLRSTRTMQSVDQAVSPHDSLDFVDFGKD